MATLYVSHASTFDHVVPPGHPERPDRIRAIESLLDEQPFQALVRMEAPVATTDTVLLVHRPDYLAMLDDARPREGLVRIDADTVLSTGSWEAALRGVGAACLAVDRVLIGRASNAFCAMRPPGHHAESARAMGFCLFNSAAIAARHAQRRHGVERVAIVDWDVHHGNGTQEIFWSDPSVLYVSTHQMPLYPGTGARSETGSGNIVNLPLSPGAGSEDFREAFEAGALPALERFAPDLLIISAGFDAHHRDPLGGLELVEEDFAWATCKLMEVANRFAEGRIVSVLEGGYDLQGLARSAAAHVAALMQA